MFSGNLTYQHEFDQRIRVALVGCGGQAFRNILPSLRYCPADLVAVCDTVPGRAGAFAATVGAVRTYADLKALLDAEEGLDAVLLATGCDADGMPRYPDQAVAVMESGRDVWMEKPPAARTRDVERMHEASVRTGRLAAVGLMKMFSPAVAKALEVMAQPEFGRPSSFYIRDPELLPAAERRDSASLVWLLDHLPHPASVTHRLMGPVSSVSVHRAHNGGGMINLDFASGAVGVWHLPWGQSSLSPTERWEVVGAGANVVCENNSRVTYYRPGQHGTGDGGYGRIGDFTSSIETAPLHWELNQYSGQPYNANIFVHGYAQEMLHFTTCVRHREPVSVGSLADAWHVTRLFEAIRDAVDAATVELEPVPGWALAQAADRAGVPAAAAVPAGGAQ
jgi:predicted dehydrogenase